MELCKYYKILSYTVSYIEICISQVIPSSLFIFYPFKSKIELCILFQINIEESIGLLLEKELCFCKTTQMHQIPI